VVIDISNTIIQKSTDNHRANPLLSNNLLRGRNNVEIIAPIVSGTRNGLAIYNEAIINMTSDSLLRSEDEVIVIF